MCLETAIWKISLCSTNSVGKARDFFQEVSEAVLGVKMEPGNGDKTTSIIPLMYPRRVAVLSFRPFSTEYLSLRPSVLIQDLFHPIMLPATFSLLYNSKPNVGTARLK